MTCTKCKINPKMKHSSWCNHCVNEGNKKRREANPEKHRVAVNSWARKNRWYKQQYYQDNIEKFKEKNTIYRDKNWLRWRLDAVNSNAKKKGHLEKISLIELEQLLASGHCEDCGSTENLTVGHGIPLFYPTGTNTMNNIMLQCAVCNRKQMTRVHIKFATDELRQWYPIYIPKINNG